MRIICLFLLFYSCQLDTEFKDLTPENAFKPAFYFNSPEFTKAMDNISAAEVDTVFSIERPKHLLPPPLHALEKRWMTTDTFAFETKDFQKVLNVIMQTAESHRDSIITSFVTAVPEEVSLNGRAAYSVPGQYYLVPQSISTGKRIFLQISRTRAAGSGFWKTWYYTANGLWLIGEKLPVDPEKDIS